MFGKCCLVLLFNAILPVQSVVSTNAFRPSS